MVVAVDPDTDVRTAVLANAAAAIIARLEEQFDLRTQIADLREKLKQANLNDQSTVATLAHRSHNHPPEVLNAATEVRREITVVLRTLDTAEKELGKYQPSRPVLRRLGTTLPKVAKHIAAYCGGLGDTALQKSAEVIGETGTKAVIWTLALNLSPQVGAVGKSLLEFAAKLVMGG